LVDEVERALATCCLVNSVSGIIVGEESRNAYSLRFSIVAFYALWDHFIRIGNRDDVIGARFYRGRDLY
jgi:hypothetical protein